MSLISDIQNAVANAATLTDGRQSIFVWLVLFKAAGERWREKKPFPETSPVTTSLIRWTQRCCDDPCDGCTGSFPEMKLCVCLN